MGDFIEHMFDSPTETRRCLADCLEVPDAVAVAAHEAPVIGVSAAAAIVGDSTRS